jgi:hypothetical protein
MNQKLLKKILLNKKSFVPLIFTNNQINTLEKYVSSKKLTNSEKKSLYTSIKNKLNALNLIFDDVPDYYIRGNPLRINEAKKIISSFPGQKVFVAGSFLHSENYDDIDIFILRQKGYKEVFEENKHIIYLTEKKLSEAVFQSAAKISVSNFNTIKEYDYKTPFLHEIMSLYHEAHIQIKNNDKKQEAARDLYFKYNLIVKNKLINSLELKQKLSLDELDLIFKEICKKLFSKKYLYVELMTYKNTLEKAINSEKNVGHLIHFKKNYEELIYDEPKEKAY